MPSPALKLAWWQTGLQRRISPGRLTKGLHCTWATWLFPNSKDEDVQSMINRILDELRAITADSSRPIVRSKRSPFARMVEREHMFDTMGDTIVRINLLTPWMKWLDTLDLRFEREFQDGSLVCHVQCLSTGVVPCIVPGAAVLNTILCFVPFHDGFETAREIDLMRELLEARLTSKISQVPYRIC